MGTVCCQALASKFLTMVLILAWMRPSITFRRCSPLARVSSASWISSLILSIHRSCLAMRACPDWGPLPRIFLASRICFWISALFSSMVATSGLLLAAVLACLRRRRSSLASVSAMISEGVRWLRLLFVSFMVVLYPSAGRLSRGISENIFMAAHHAVGHVAVRVPLLLASALFAGREVTEVPVVLIVLVHGCIIHASARGVKGVRRKTFKSKSLSCKGLAPKRRPA